MSEQVNLRSIVLDILLAVNRDGEFSHIAVSEMLDKFRYLPHRDRAFVKRMSEGTIERQLELDYIIDQFSKTKVKKMKPVIRAIMESGVYQLKYMDSVPDSAVCNESVKLAGKRGFSGLKGFVNGVLRNISRNLDQIVWPSMEKEPVKAISVKYSVPEWMAERWIQQFGQERCIHIAEAFLEKNTTCVRVDTRKCSPEEVKESLVRQGIKVGSVTNLPDAFYLDGYDVLDEIPEFEDGILYAQDVSSMMVARMALGMTGDQLEPDDLPADRTLFAIDVCAAPGGKSIHLAQLLGAHGKVEARDLTEYKVGLIEENVERCQIKNLTAKVWDATEFDSSTEEKADFVIADLPCSGLGVIGSKTDIKYKASPEKISSLVELQRQILSTVYKYVKPEGTLMYSTCTITQEENQGNVAWFLENYPQFELINERQFLPDEGCDGFYIAKMRRKK